MPTKSEAIKTFLTNVTHADLANQYCFDMECVVTVAQDCGDPITKEYRGHKWQGWTDGMQTWKPFWIPRQANTEPTYEDNKIGYDLAAHAEGIGMTGWNWKKRQTLWVAFDFDSITNHKKGLTDEEMREIEELACAIPWVTVRRSTSGKGLHLYVYTVPVDTANHKEHSAFARAILGRISALTGFDFQAKIDTCGGNMWIWHRKMKGTNGLELIKQGLILTEIPDNWREHIRVVQGKVKRTVPVFIEGTDQEDLFDELTGQRPTVQLDEDHRKLIDYLKESNARWWWDQDHNMLVAHTFDLKEAYDSLCLKGLFETVATGRERGSDHNCFMFPLRGGGWVVRRFSLGTSEAPTWDTDSAGWTRCYYNRTLDFAAACRARDGLESESGDFEFRIAEQAVKAAQLLGAHPMLPACMLMRKASLKKHKDGRLVFKIEHDDRDQSQEMEGWLPNKGRWMRFFTTTDNSVGEPEISNYDDVVRHLVTETGEDYGWVINSEGEWRSEPLQHVKAALQSMGISNKDAGNVVGSSVLKCWTLTTIPFQPEYVGGRRWNRHAPQLKYEVKADTENLQYPTWLKVLNHIGAGLNREIANNAWAQANGIYSGADYLKCWIASMFKEPLEPLPYLFLFGGQDCGKSILHEALSLLITSGYQRADVALISQSGFNGELENAVLCVVEETDLRKNTNAYNRIKDWVTSKQLPIHRKGRTPFHVPNATHWIQCDNDPQACPVFTGDTRITMIHVAALEASEMIPKKTLLRLLETEARDFLTELLGLELPSSNDRLNVPVIATQDKMRTARANLTALEMFLEENCYYVPGELILFSEFYDRFMSWLEPSEQSLWTKIKVGKELASTKYIRARRSSDANFCLANISWEPLPEGHNKPRLVPNNSNILVSEEQ